MKIDDTYWYLRRRANEAAYLHSQGGTEERYVDNLVGHLADQIEKLNAGKLLALIDMPKA
jgi:hypothetical protein